MDREKLESLLIDYLDDRLNPDDRRVVERELSQDPEARKLYEELREVIQVIENSAEFEPPVRLKGDFAKVLEEEWEERKSAPTKTIFFQHSFYRVAAAIALLIIGGGLGFWISKNQAQQARLADIEKEMQLTRKQLADTRQMMFGMLQNDQSASQRIKGVRVAMGVNSADAEIVKALFNTLLMDPSTNVRLAALDALSRFREDEDVKKGLIDALSRQTDPMVQITLIQLMVEMKEKKAVKDLQRIVDDAGVMPAVRDEAYSGILKLS